MFLKTDCKYTAFILTKKELRLFFYIFIFKEKSITH